MSMTKREKTVVRNGAAKLKSSKIYTTNPGVRSAIKIMEREANLCDPADPVDEASIEK